MMLQVLTKGNLTILVHLCLTETRHLDFGDLLSIMCTFMQHDHNDKGPDINEAFRSQVHKEIRKDFQHESSPAEFCTSQYLLNSALLVVPIKFRTSLQI